MCCPSSFSPALGLPCQFIAVLSCFVKTASNELARRGRNYSFCFTQSTIFIQNARLRRTSCTRSFIGDEFVRRPLSNVAKASFSPGLADVMINPPLPPPPQSQKGARDKVTHCHVRVLAATYLEASKCDRENTYRIFFLMHRHRIVDP